MMDRIDHLWSIMVLVDHLWSMMVLVDHLWSVIWSLVMKVNVHVSCVKKPVICKTRQSPNLHKDTHSELVALFITWNVSPVYFRFLSTGRADLHQP